MHNINIYTRHIDHVIPLPSLRVFAMCIIRSTVGVEITKTKVPDLTTTARKPTQDGRRYAEYILSESEKHIQYVWYECYHLMIRRCEVSSNYNWPINTACFCAKTAACGVLVLQ